VLTHVREAVLDDALHNAAHAKHFHSDVTLHNLLNMRMGAEGSEQVQVSQMPAQQEDTVAGERQEVLWQTEGTVTIGEQAGQQAWAALEHQAALLLVRAAATAEAAAEWQAQDALPAVSQCLHCSSNPPGGS